MLRNLLTSDTHRVVVPTPAPQQSLCDYVRGGSSPSHLNLFHPGVAIRFLGSDSEDAASLHSEMESNYSDDNLLPLATMAKCLHCTCSFLIQYTSFADENFCSRDCCSSYAMFYKLPAKRKDNTYAGTGKR